jgi:hypothetical protein
MEKGSKFVVVERQSSRVTEKETKIIDKAQARKSKTNDPGNDSNPFSVFNKFQSSHFVHVALYCGIELGNGDTSMVEIINTMEAQAMLNEARIRREREIQMERDKSKQFQRELCWK